ncbi:MAG: phage holin family protein [Candidatus Paceibacterota bacterium]
MFIIQLIFYLFSNVVALMAAAHFINGFTIEPGLNNLLLAAVVLTFINAIIRPIIKLIFTPIIFLTFGLGVLVVNTLMLYLLDKLLPSITITGILPLFYATLIISVVNLVVNFSAKRIAG